MMVTPPADSGLAPTACPMGISCTARYGGVPLGLGPAPVGTYYLEITGGTPVHPCSESEIVVFWIPD